MKRRLLARCLSCLLAGLLLTETPIQVFAAQDGSVEEPGEEIYSEDMVDSLEDEDLNVKVDLSADVSASPEDVSNIDDTEEDLNKVSASDGPESPEDTSIGNPETAENDDSIQQKPEGDGNIPENTGKIEAEGGDKAEETPNILEDFFLLTGPQYETETEYHTSDLDALITEYAEWITELSEELEKQTTELNLADKKASVEVFQDLLTYIVNGEDAGNTYTALEPKVAYTYIEQENDAENGEITREIQTAELSYLPEEELESLTAPENPQAEGADSSIKLTWDAVEGATGYEVEIYNETEDEFTLLEAVIDNEYVHNSLENGESHVYRVRAVRQQELLRSAPEYSDYSEKVEGRTIPGVPSVSYATNTADSVSLQWDVVKGADGYRIYQEGEETPLADTSELSYTISGLTAGTEYRYEVSAYSGSGDNVQEGTRSSVLYVMPMLQKVSVSVQRIAYNQLQVKWNASVPEAEYEVYRRADNGERQLLQKVSGGTLSFTDNSVNFDTTYYYQVRPVVKKDDRVYYGEYSAEASGISNMDVVKLQTVSTADSQSLNISWNQVAGATGYEVYRSNTSKNGFVRVASVGANVTSYTDKGLALGNRYYYQVRACAAANGKTAYSNFSPEVSGVVKLSQVTGLNVTMTKVNTLQLTWNKVSDATTYEVYYSTSPNSGYKRLTSTKKNFYKFSKAKCGQTYYFKVRTYQKVKKAKYYSDYSAVVSGKTVLTGTPSIYVSKTTYNSVTIKWKKVKDAKKYEIYYATSPDGEYKLLKTQGGTSFTHKKLTTGTTYYYKIRPIRDFYYGNYSNVISGRPVLGQLKGLKVSSGNNQLKVSWKKVSGTGSYVILRSSSASGNYTEVARTNKTSYTDKGLNASTTYYYKVYAIAGVYQTNTVGPVSQTTKAPKVPKPASSSSGTSNKKYYGVDVSSYQGKIDWEAVADDGIDFAMIRILTGKSTSNLSVDTRFEYNYSRAKAAGIKVGVYRYSYATTRTKARREAEKIIEVLDGRSLRYPIVLDMEDATVLNGTTKEKRTQIIQTYKEVIEGAGYKFALYANKTWLENYIEPEALKGVDVWLARWRSLDKGPGYNGPGNLTMWQYTNSGRVDGISGNVDRNVSYKKY